jgi:hypothetical protein
MEQKVLGYFSKPAVRQFKEALEEEGFKLSLENVRPAQSKPKVKISVDQNDYTRALELVKKVEIQYLIQARAKARAFEHRAMTVFIIFAFIFVVYIIISNL